MIFYKNVRFKLIVWYLFILCLILIPFSTYLYYSLAKSLREQLDYELKAKGEEVKNILDDYMERNEIKFLTKDRGMKARLNAVSEYIHIRDSNGYIIYRSERFKKHPLPSRHFNFDKITPENSITQSIVLGKNKGVRVITLLAREKKGPDCFVQVGLPLKDINYPLNRLLLTLVIAIPTTLIISSLFGWFFVYKSLNPIDEITKTARKIGDGDLSQRLKELKSNDEVGRLVETFNNMISKLEESFKQIRQFTADVSHELRTPLTIMKGEVEVALRKRRLPEEYEKIMNGILEEVELLTKIVEDLLFLERAESGVIKLNQEEINLNFLLGNIVEQFKTIMERKKLDFYMHVEPEDIVINGDAMQLRKLFLNLLDNAIKYTDEGGKINLSILSTGKYAKVILTDTGIGIPEKELFYIFKRFYRVDKSRAGDTGGSGLGLSICETIVRVHNGRIEVESIPNFGSTFKVFLPR